MTPQNRKTKIIHLISNGNVESLLGVIKWFGRGDNIISTQRLTLYIIVNV